MNIIPIERLENEIDNTLELSSICRGEWCRSLESKVDVLEDELIEARKVESLTEGRIVDMSNKIQESYRNLGPDIHV